MKIFTNTVFCVFSKNLILLFTLILSFLQLAAQTESNLTLTKSADVNIANVGDTVTFTIIIRNNGPETATNVRVTDILASGYTFVSATPSIGTWSGPIWSVGNMAKDATASMVLRAKINPFGNYTNTAAIKADEPDPNLADNHSKISLGVIRAIDDYLYINSTTGGQGIGNVLINDFLNGYPAKLDNINIAQVAASSSYVALDVVNGKINVEPNTPTGNYSITYKITDKSNAGLSATGTVNINVNNNSSGNNTLPIEAKNDEGFIEVSKAGIALFNVLANDLLSGAQATTSNVILELVSVANPNITLDLGTGSINATDNIPLGIYTLVYKITSRADAAITATGSVAINVVDIGSLKVSDDFGTIDALGGVAIANVLANDLLNGGIAALADVTLETAYVQPGSGLMLDPNTGEIIVPPGTPNGVYTLTYKVTEKAVPTSFALADAIVMVTGGISLIEAKEDTGVADGTNGGVAIENVLANDDLEGSVPLLSQVNLSQGTFNNSNGNVNLDFTTGRVIVNPGTPNGTYTLVYIIEDKAKPGSSSYADAYVTVTGGISLVTAIEDAGFANGITGGTAVANVLLNDDFKGTAPLISEVNLTQSFSNHPGVRLDESTGEVVVDPGTENGVYTIAYNIYDKNDPGSFSYADVIVSVTEGIPVITAYPDTGTANGTIGGIAVSNVLANDSLGVNTPNVANVNLTQVSSTHSGVSLNVVTGEVVVAMGTPVGAYILEYQIEDKANPGNVSTASVTVTVTKTSQVIATNDLGKINGITGGTAVANVLANDIVEGITPLLSQVILTEIFYEVPPGTVRLDANTGRVVVAPGTPPGFWTISYRIEDRANPGSFSDADATVEVTDNILPLLAKDDSGVVDGIVGGTAIPSVLINDTFNGLPVSPADVDIVLDYNPEPKISLDLATGEVKVAPNTPAGIYALVYTIKDKTDPVNTATAYIEVAVTNSGILAKDDIASIDGDVGGAAVTDVLANDILDGTAPLINQVNLAQVSSSHSGVSLDVVTGKILVAVGTPAGTYTLVYQIEDKTDPGKISQAKAIITVTKIPRIAANEDRGKVNRIIGGIAIANVLANDILQGAVPQLSQVNIIQIYTNHPDINLDIQTGSVKVLAGVVPVGFYTVTYVIEDKASPGITAVADAIIEITDDVLPLVAADDAGAIDGLIGGTAILNVLANDTFNGLPATIAEVDITLDYNPEPKISLEVATGEVKVAPNTPAGEYHLTYSITDKVNPSIKSTANIKITVNSATISAADDAGTIGTNGGVAVNNILVNDVVNGQAATLNNVNISLVSSNSLNITLDPLTGRVLVAGTGTGVYELVYKIADKLDPLNTAIATVRVTVIAQPSITIPLVAQDDTGTIDGVSGGIAIPDILVNDTYNGNPATLNEVIIEEISPNHPNIILEPSSGRVVVNPGTPADRYHLVYKITDKINPTNFKEAKVTITVTNSVISATDDAGTINGITGGEAIPNILINDTFNGLDATLANVVITQLSSSSSKVKIEEATGRVLVDAGTPAETYILVYKITDKLNPLNSANATVTIIVTTSGIVVANNDNGAVNGLTGGVAVGNILVNDLLNGNPALLNNVDIEFVSASANTITLNPLNATVAITANTPAGNYTLVYKITDKSNPAIFDEAAVTVNVTAPPITAADDAGTVPTSGGTAVNQVLENDTYNNLSATLAGVIIDQISTTHSGVNLDPLTGKVNVAQGTPAGQYVVNYQIIDRLNPTNLANANVLVTVFAPTITPVNDQATVSGLTDVVAIPNILVNDNLNGVQATVTNVVISDVAPTDPLITVDVVTGAVNVAAGILPGVYNFKYRISEIGNPANTNTAEITITVTGLTRIGIAKTVSTPQPQPDGSYNLTYTLNIKNYGNTQLTNISVVDDLKLTFPSPLTFNVMGNVSANGTLVADPLYDGSINTSLLSNGSTLLPSITATVSFVVNVKLNKASGKFLNKAIASAISAGGETTTDESTDGINPDPDGNNIPDENEETPVELRPITIYIPEGFSPNNDGINDKFIIKSTAGDQISLEVYNRWGNIVYKNADYKNEWDGRSNQGIKIGEDLPDGTYFYIVIVNGQEKFVRYITLKR